MANYTFKSTDIIVTDNQVFDNVLPLLEYANPDLDAQFNVYGTVLEVDSTSVTLITVQKGTLVMNTRPEDGKFYLTHTLSDGTERDFSCDASSLPSGIELGEAFVKLADEAVRT